MFSAADFFCRSGTADSVDVTLDASFCQLGFPVFGVRNKASVLMVTKEMVSYLKAEGASEDCIMIGLGDLYVTVTGARIR